MSYGWLVGCVLLIATAAVGAESLIFPKDIGCGSYRLTGRMSERPDGISVVKIYPDTTAEFEIPILGVSGEQALTLDGASVSLEVKMAQGKKSRYPRGKLVKVLSSGVSRERALRDAVQVVQTLPCR